MRFVCAVAMVLTTGAAVAPAGSPGATTPSAAIPLDEVGAVATRQVEGDSLSVTATENGARLRCAFQRMEGTATPEGLWLSSTAERTTGERFRVMAISVGRDQEGGRASSRALTFLEKERKLGLAGTFALPLKGRVSVEGKVARFTRPGLTEDYSVSVDGVRQDFMIAERPEGKGELRLELALTGAQAAPAAYGAKLTLDGSGRTLAYSRLRATDATGKDLKAQIEVRSADRLAVRVDDAGALYPLRIDPTFSDADWVSLNSLPGTDGWIYALAVDESGNLYVGGSFGGAGAAVANNVAKWDGSEWSSLGSGIGEGPAQVYSGVWALAVIGTDLYAGGEFITAGGVTVNRIAKWDGGQWSALGSGIGGDGDLVRVRTLAAIGTNLYAGGRFTIAGGMTVSHIAKWNGSEWSALGSGISGVGQYGGVRALAVIGTDLYVGGSFTTAGGVTVNHVAKWNGNSWSALGSGVDGAFPGYEASVDALAVSGSTLYAGGNFTTVGGISANHVARWNGSSWSPLGSGMGAAYSYAPSVHALAVIGTDLYAGGQFNTADGLTVNFIAKWDGSAWSPLGSGVGAGGYGWVYALAVIGTDLYAGGEFTNPSGVTAIHVAEWDGSQWSALGGGLGGADWGQVCVWALATGETNLYAGGVFTTIGGVTVNNVAKWDGSSWSALGAGVSGFGVAALAVSGTDLYAGGAFTLAGGVPANNIAKWDGSSWSALGSGTDAAVIALAASGADLYAGGPFTTAGGVLANAIAKWNGATWSSLGPGLSGGWEPCKALTTIGTDLYAGGQFTTAGAVTANGIAKWNGSAWSSLGSGTLFSTGTGTPEPGMVYALAVMGTDLYAGGHFTSVGGVPANRIARWNGTTWSSLGSESSGTVPLAVVQALTVGGTDLYAGGWLPDAHMGIIKWDGSSWSPLGSGLTGFRSSDGIRALTTDDSGHLFVGGRFVSAGNAVSPFVIQASITGLEFTWDEIASPQQAGVPIPVTLQARNAAGDMLADFTDSVNLSGYAAGLTAANIAVGTGTGSWGYPLHTRYHDARTQVIYLASELGRACTINSLALDVTTAPGQTLEHWTIRLKHTSLGEYASSPSWEGSGWTVVYQADEPAGSTGWRTFSFNTPFEYDGTNNLLVDFSFNNASYGSEGQCQSTVIGAYRSITYATDSKDGDPLSWSGTTPAPVRSQNVPNIKLAGTYPDLIPVTLSPTVTTAFVNGVWTGTVTVHEAVTNLVLQADDGLGHGGESNPFDVQAVPPALRLVMSDDPFSFTNGCYGFAVQGQAGQVVVIEASTNLVHWLPIHTNLMGDLGQCLFHDLHTGQFPRRCYRARLYEGALPPPALLSGEAAMVGAQFRLAVGAVGGQEVVVEASTDLVEWQPIQTNTAGIGPCYFYDPDMTNFTRRFYRAVTP